MAYGAPTGAVSAQRCRRRSSELTLGRNYSITRDIYKLSLRRNPRTAALSTSQFTLSARIALEVEHVVMTR